MTARPADDRGGLSRRAMVRGGLLGGVSALGLAGGVAALPHDPGGSPTQLPDAEPGPPPGGPAGELVEAFHGEHQSGITTPPQPHGVFVGLDLVEGAGRTELERLMRVWTDDISRLMAGRAPLTDQEPELAARTAGLTVTVGWGTTLPDKVGLVAPTWLRPVPPMAVDQLEDAWGEADLLLQLCAHSPVTLGHARQHLVDAARGIAEVRWVQPGFREPMEHHGWSLRNQFGQVDGTVQPDVAGRDAALLWVQDGAWSGGSSLVLRRIEMDLPDWSRADRVAREHAVGRDLATGAPLTGGEVDTPVDLHATLPNGLTVIDGAAHVRRAGPQAPHERFLRRPYTYEQVGPDGSVRTGLLFAAYQADPVRQFVPVQRRLAEADLMNLWTTPVGSAVFALLPGCADGDWLGRALLT